MSQRLKTALKVRNAVITLAKSNAPYKNVSKQTSEELEAANRRVDTTQTEVWRLSERSNEIQRKLLEHRAAVLSQSVRNLEKKLAPHDENGAESSTSGYSTPNRSSQMSPTGTSVTSVATSSSKGRFDGAHFFAGHSDAIIPRTFKPLRTPSDIASLEDNLKSVTELLEETKTKLAATARELAELRLAKEQIQTSMALSLQSAEETIAELQQEQEEWMRDRAELETRRREVDTLERRLEVLEEESGEATEIKTLLAQEREKSVALVAEKDREIEELNLMYEADRTAWDVEKETLQHGSDSQDLLEEHAQSLQALLQEHGVQMGAQDVSLETLMSSLRSHLEAIRAQLEIQEQGYRELVEEKARLEADAESHVQEREAMAKELEELQRAKQASDLEIRGLEAQIRVGFLIANLHVSLVSQVRALHRNSRCLARQRISPSSNTKATQPTLWQHCNLSGPYYPPQRLVRANWVRDLHERHRQLPVLSLVATEGRYQIWTSAH